MRAEPKAGSPPLYATPYAQIPLSAPVQPTADGSVPHQLLMDRFRMTSFRYWLARACPKLFVLLRPGPLIVIGNPEYSTADVEILHPPNTPSRTGFRWLP